MNVDDFLFNVRLVLKDPADATNNPDQKWSDAEILEHGSRMQQSLTRIQIEKGRDFSNFALALQAASAQQLYDTSWQWRLPTWVSSVSSVFRLNDGTSATEVTFSPYLWSKSLPLSAAGRIEKIRQGVAQGYRWDGIRTLRVWGFSSAPKLCLEVATTPAPLFKATIGAQPSVAAGLNEMYLPVTGLVGREGLEEGCYVNAQIHVSSATDLENVGIVQRCVYSKANILLDSARRQKLTFDGVFHSALAQNDVVQSVIPFSDEHTRALVLLTANQCLMKEGAVPIMKALAPELSRELAAFAQYAGRKDYDGPDFIEAPDGTNVGTAPNYDRDNSLR